MAIVIPWWAALIEALGGLALGGFIAVWLYRKQ